MLIFNHGKHRKSFLQTLFDNSANGPGGIVDAAGNIADWVKERKDDYWAIAANLAVIGFASPVIAFAR